MTHTDRIEQRGNKWVILSYTTGEVLGSYNTKEEAVARLRQIEGHSGGHAGAYDKAWDGGKKSDSVRVQRFDIGTLRKPTMTPHGFMKVDGYASRTGVFLYQNADGSTRRELRLPEEVFASESLAGFEDAPLTNDHPAEFVDSRNAKDMAVGHVTGPARREGNFVKISAIVTDAAMIEELKAGKNQLSVGYSANVVEESGEHPEFGKYDSIQRNIVVNHLAVVDAGRAGPQAAVRMDASETGAMTPTIPLDSGGVAPYLGAIMTAEELKRALDAALADSAAQKARADANEAALKEANLRADKAEGTAAELAPMRAELEKARADLKTTEELRTECDALRGKVTELEKARADAKRDYSKALTAAVRERTALEGHARTVLGDEFRCDGLSDRDLVASVLRKLGRTVDEKESDERLRARFDAAVENYTGTEQAMVRVKERVAAQKKDADRYDRSSARQRMIDRNRGRAPQESK